MPSATVVFPDHEELDRRLKAVDDDPNIALAFHAKVLPSAGRKLTGAGVSVVLSVAFEECRVEEGLSPSAARTLLLQLPDYARALVEDPEVRRVALERIALALPA